MSEQTPEGRLIGDALRRMNLSARKAAEQAGISEGRWRQIVKGYQTVSPGHTVPVRGPADTVARMAQVVGLTADNLAEAGRDDAADSLDELFGGRETTHPGAARADAMKTRLRELIRIAQADRGMTTRALADKMDVSEKTVWNMIEGGRWPQAHNLRRLEQVLDFTPGILSDLIVTGVDPAAVTLSTLRTPASNGWGVVPALRASKLSDAELLQELAARVGDKDRRIAELEARLGQTHPENGNVHQLHSGVQQSRAAFDAPPLFAPDGIEH